MRCREGNVKAQMVKSVNSDTINTIVDKHIEKGSVLCTDEARMYSDIDRYVNEFAFRLNGGNCKIDTIERTVNLTVRAVGKQATYTELVT